MIQVSKEHTRILRRKGSPSATIQSVKTVTLQNTEKSIGEGTFGKVKLGTHHITGEKVSILNQGIQIYWK
jgi:hypothetical protein